MPVMEEVTEGDLSIVYKSLDNHFVFLDTTKTSSRTHRDSDTIQRPNTTKNVGMQKRKESLEIFPTPTAWSSCCISPTSSLFRFLLLLFVPEKAFFLCAFLQDYHGGARQHGSRATARVKIIFLLCSSSICCSLSIPTQ